MTSNPLSTVSIISHQIPTHNVNANENETNQSSISFNPFSKNFGIGLNLAITFPRINASGTGP